jgi:hypothetical protein
VNDLPELPDDVAAEVESLDPAEFNAPPAPDPDDLSIRSLDPLREWLRDVRAGKTVLAVFDIPDDVLDQNMENIIADFRSQGVNLRDRRELLMCALVWQTSMVSLLHELEHCGAGPGDIIHLYVHIARPLLNMALAFELLILAEFGAEAALLPEGGE